VRFIDFFELVREHEDMDEEQRRIAALDAVDWRQPPTRWVLMAMEHCAVMIDRWNHDHKDETPTLWIAIRQRVYAELMRRLMPVREAINVGDCQAA
jgi:hypothetical protein